MLLVARAQAMREGVGLVEMPILAVGLVLGLVLGLLVGH